MSNFKYIDKKWIGGKWQYIYDVARSKSPISVNKGSSTIDKRRNSVTQKYLDITDRKGRGLYSLTSNNGRTKTSTISIGTGNEKKYVENSAKVGKYKLTYDNGDGYHNLTVTKDLTKKKTESSLKKLKDKAVSSMSDAAKTGKNAVSNAKDFYNKKITGDYYKNKREDLYRIGQRLESQGNRAYEQGDKDLARSNWGQSDRAYSGAYKNDIEYSKSLKGRLEKHEFEGSHDRSSRMNKNEQRKRELRNDQKNREAANKRQKEIERSNYRKGPVERRVFSAKDMELDRTGIDNNRRINQYKSSINREVRKAKSRRPKH